MNDFHILCYTLAVKGFSSFSGANPALAEFTAGYDYRRMQLPLRVTDVRAVDSISEPQVQLADVIAGATAFFLKSDARFTEGSFQNQLARLFVQKLLIRGLWPSREVDPEKLGTAVEPQEGEFDLATYTSMIFRGDPRTLKA